MKQGFYSGVREINLTDEETAQYYQNGIISVEDLTTNEYVLLRNNDKLVDKLKYKNNELIKIKNKAINNSITGKIRPLNEYQELIFDMIADNNLTVKSCTGIPGGGKSFLFLAFGLQKVLNGEFDKIIYIKNNVDIAHKDLGATPGGVEEKLDPWIGVLYDVFGDKYLVDKLKNENKLETQYLGYSVGRTWHKAFIVCDDSQQLSRQHVYNLTTRLGQNSVICFAGDVYQTYSKKYENSNSGIKFLHEQLGGEDFFTCVHTKKSERSYTAQRCAELLFEGVSEHLK